ncbi:uncharacterized protein B0I36DRAFT_370386 [Microdochium trichocladiopsis]|uniref:Uncharacterized protein n=1 Tax=Microdochium trichocladiopsis TaxID=1682393 RepID=A0A9P8XPU4_9PEZI|nr:uncharacterized protein B0I36DRAFT_370386 [Microdochium trichocladiopsis]KAH7009454.1 hypothetical protein B0I36DRAFT_370386 [Microdochium trichocladiopsis]
MVAALIIRHSDNQLMEFLRTHVTPAARLVLGKGSSLTHADCHARFTLIPADGKVFDVYLCLPVGTDFSKYIFDGDEDDHSYVGSGTNTKRDLLRRILDYLLGFVRGHPSHKRVRHMVFLARGFLPLVYSLLITPLDLEYLSFVSFFEGIFAMLLDTVDPLGDNMYNNPQIRQYHVEVLKQLPAIGQPHLENGLNFAHPLLQALRRPAGSGPKHCKWCPTKLTKFGCYYILAGDPGAGIICNKCFTEERTRLIVAIYKYSS